MKLQPRRLYTTLANRPFMNTQIIVDCHARAMVNTFYTCVVMNPVVGYHGNTWECLQ